jgi:hypothetical protein
VSAISSVCEWYIHITELPSSGPLRDLPEVGVATARGYGVVGFVRAAGGVVVRRALAVLTVEQPVHVHRGGEVARVAEHHLDGVADLGADDRAEHAEVGLVGRSGLPVGERRVGVAAVEALEVARADPAGPLRT